MIFMVEIIARLVMANKTLQMLMMYTIFVVEQEKFNYNS